MKLFLEALFMLIRSKDKSLGVKEGSIRLELEKNILRNVQDAELNGFEWILPRIISQLKQSLGQENTYHTLKKIGTSYNSELKESENNYLKEQLSRIEEEIVRNGGSIKKRNNENDERKFNDIKNFTQSEGVKEQVPKDLQILKPEINSSYSGSDITASINIPGKGAIVFGELTNISYSVFREKVPVRGLGRVSMKGYTRGMRTISGILSFTVFDESIVYKCLDELRRNGYRPLMDEMPLFDVTITMANEYGQKSSMSIYGVSTFTEGMSLSIDDLMTQNVYEFYALDIDPIMKLKPDERGR